MKINKPFLLFFCMLVCFTTIKSAAYSPSGLRTHWLSDLIAQNKKKLAAFSGVTAIAGLVYAYRDRIRDRIYKFYNDFRFSQLLREEWNIISVKKKRADALENPPARVRGWRSQEEEGLFGKKVKVLKYDDQKPVTKTGKFADTPVDIKADYAADQTVLCEKFRKDFFPEIHKKMLITNNSDYHVQILQDEAARLSKFSNFLPEGLNITKEQATAAMKIFIGSVYGTELWPEKSAAMDTFLNIEEKKSVSVGTQTSSVVVHKLYTEIFGQEGSFGAGLLRILNDDVQAVMVPETVDNEGCRCQSAVRFVNFNQNFLPTIGEYLSKKAVSDNDKVGFLEVEIDKLHSNVLCGGDADFKNLQDKKVIVAAMQRLVSHGYRDNALFCSDNLGRKLRGGNLIEGSLEDDQDKIYKFFNPVKRPMKISNKKDLSILSREALRENLSTLLQQIELPRIED